MTKNDLLQNKISQNLFGTKRGQVHPRQPHLRRGNRRGAGFLSHMSMIFVCVWYLPLEFVTPREVSMERGYGKLSLGPVRPKLSPSKLITSQGGGVMEHC